MKSKVRKRAKISQAHAKTIIAIIIIGIISVFYFGFLKDRYTVMEYEGFVENPLFTQKNPPVFENEFCANKLSMLAQEIHYLENEIRTQESKETKYNAIKKTENEIISIESSEIQDKKEAFFDMLGKCRRFDIDHPQKLCSLFIQTAENDVLKLRQTMDQTQNIIEKARIWIHNITKSKRMISELRKSCSDQR